MSRRFGGLLVDWLILLPWYLAVDLVVRHAHVVTLTRASGTTYRHLTMERPSVVVALLILVPGAAYVIGLIATRGRTLGQQALHLRVVRIADLGALVDPDPAARVALDAVATPPWRASALRWLVLGCLALAGAFVRVPALAALPFQLVVLLWAYWDANGQGLHDKAGGVVVLNTR